MADHDTLCRQQHWEGGDCFDCRLIAKVRADERERTPVVYGYTAVLSNLRAKVEAMRGPHGDYEIVAIDDVLALLDGSNSD